MKYKLMLVAIGVIFLAVAGLFVCVALQPPSTRPRVTIAFGGYTNDAAGRRLAAFTVSNASLSAVRRLSHYRIQILTSTRWTNISGGWLSGGASILPPSGAETVMVVAPPNQTSWRPWFAVSPDVGMVKDMMGSVIDAARSLGLPTRYRKTMYGAYSDWISE
jgi:hypothetical protein